MRKFASAVGLGFVLLGAVGCSGAQRYEITGVNAAQGADATLEVEEEDQGTVGVAIAVQHLLPPERVQTNAEHYAVWIRHQDRAPIHAGNLAYDSEKRTGSLRVSTPHRQFSLSITAEVGENPAFPSDDVVFRQAVTVDD
ncbi:MAG: hypothetical protein B6A08_16290 [Sorangiineae bacterium NIC37A_2]|jgi:hypothetical protein|nr:MAG: hypothetical protein B6A08_16290 [Sorangiineae bacterium NIC37A_2]